VNPGKYIADLGVFLTLVFLAVAVTTATRRGNSSGALLIGGSAALFLLAGGFIAIIQDLGVVTLPLFLPVAFLVIVGALSYKFVDDAFKARDAALEVAQLRRVITLGEMVGGITHEINQPLSAIQSNAQAGRRFLAGDNADAGEIRDIFDDIVADGKRASEIIHGIRRMLQRESTKGATADASKVILAASDLVKGELHARDVTLRVNARPTGNLVRADSMELMQVIMNLLLNAIRAASEMGKHDRLVTINYEEEDGVGLFSVEDRGPGINDELIDRLFEPFVSRSEDGLGIGLSVCKRIIERTNGSISAEQRDGGGAVFQIRLPLAGEGSEA
jgi:two-component system sensor kinase FixL